MSIKRDIPQITALRHRVEERFGKTLAVHSDFLALVAEIEMVQRQHISESTLERIWGYSTRGYETVSLRSLDVLAHYALGEDWNKFCQRLQTEAGDESELFNVERITTADLREGDRLIIGWLPNRLCEVRYLGQNRFVAERCENSKMGAGDTFSCLEFTLGKELVMCDFGKPSLMEGASSMSYIVGRKNGLTTLRKVE